MIGIVTETHLHHRFGYTAGGLISCPGMADRIRFDAGKLVGLTIADASGREVVFDVLDNMAVRVRPRRRHDDNSPARR
jgi:hypothetical protein